MKTLPALLETHYSAGTTTLADLLKITRTDGEIYAFTSAADDVTISGQVYTSAQGLNISSIEVAAGFAVDNLELTTLDDGTVFTKIEVLAGVWRNADFTISRYNWASPTDGVEVRMVGTVGEVHLHRGYVTAELRGLQQYLQQPIGSVSSKTCRARLGDTLCGVALAPFTTTGSVTTPSTRQTFSTTLADVVLGTDGDASYDFVSLLLHGDGTNGSSTFADNSPTPKTITAVGNAQISTAQSKWGGASMLFDGTGDYLTAPNAGSFNPGSGDFTCEAWIYSTSTDATNIKVIATSRPTSPTSGWSFYHTAVAAGAVQIGIVVWTAGSVTTVNLASGATLATNAWSHVAFTKQATAWRLFINGTLAASATETATCANTTTFYVGRDPSNTARDFKGHIDDFRVTLGVARYTATFTPSVAAFEDAGPTPTAPAPAADYFTEGILTWDSGVNAGLSQKVKTYGVDGSVTLILPMIQDVSSGNTFSVVAGCRKRLEDCITKFDNVLNFQGEPHLPGIDEVTR